MREQYSPIAKFFHWLIAGLIVSQYVLAKLAEQAGDAEQEVQQVGLLANHKSIGMTILILALARFGWRLLNQPPALPASIASWQRVAARIVHRLLYILLFAIPLSGWLMTSAKDYSVSWFNLFAFPDIWSANETQAEFFHKVHHLLVELLLVVLAVHILAVIKHQIFEKNKVLSRMSSALGWLVFFLSIALVYFYLGRVE